MNFKKVIYNIMPCGLLERIQAKRYPKRSVIKLDRTLPDIEEVPSKFKYIVSVEGFGFSGSGTVVDLLREYNNTLVFGSIDVDGSKTKGNKHINGEVDFLRHTGGLFEIEKYLKDGNLFTKDALIKNFKSLINSSYFFRNPAASKLVNQFYNQILDIEIDTYSHNDYNGHIANTILRPDSNIKIIKWMTVDEYRALCRRFISSCLNLYYQDGAKYLVLDQFLSDLNFDTERNKAYIPNSKSIVVTRDPRDQYYYAVSRNVPWMPDESAEQFIRWHKQTHRKFNCDSKDYLVVRFEDMVNDYNKQVKRIEEYLDLQAVNHTLTKVCFDPSFSAKNIGIWKQAPELSADMEKIHSALSEYCYNQE